MTIKEVKASNKNIFHHSKHNSSLEAGHWVRVNSTWYDFDGKRYDKEEDPERWVFDGNHDWQFKELEEDELVWVITKILEQ